MPRSSRHKSSKRSSKDAGDYSYPEKESTLRERKSKEESGAANVSKESGSGEKRKLDTKELYDYVNGDYYSSKRHKEKNEDSGNDRWNGGDDERGVISKISKRRDTAKSSGKADGKHRESSRRESKEFDKDKIDKLFDSEDHHGSKIVPGKAGKVS